MCIRDSAGNLYYYKNTGYVYYFDSEAFEAAYAELTESLPEIAYFSDTKIKATVNMAEGDNMMYTSIPFDKGWTVKVDGKRVKLDATVTEADDEKETEYKANNKVFGALLAFEVPEGEHTVELSFTPQGFRIGAVLAIAGLTIVTVGLVKSIKRDRRRRKSKLAAYRAAAAGGAPLPEEDELIAAEAEEEDEQSLEDLKKLDGDETE